MLRGAYVLADAESPTMAVVATGSEVELAVAAKERLEADGKERVRVVSAPCWDQFERGPSDFHQPHRLIADASLSLPFATQLSGVLTAASGLPVNPTTGRDNNGDSYNVDRPIGLGRNAFRGPAQASVDVAGATRVRVRPGVQVEGRVEIFNLLNRQNFIKVNNIYGEGPAPLPTFLAGVAGITNVDPSRQVQFSAKLIF